MGRGMMRGILVRARARAVLLLSQLLLSQLLLSQLLMVLLLGVPPPDSGASSRSSAAH